MEETEMENEELPKNENDDSTSLNENGENQEKSNDLKSALAQKEHFREKAQKLEEQLKAAQGKNQEGNKNESNVSNGTDPLEIVTLSKSLSSYSDEETKLIIDAAKDKTPKGILAALNSEVVKDAIAYRREKVERENKRPEPTEGFSNGFIDKPMKEIEKMTNEEFTVYERELLEKSKQRTGRSGA